MTTQSNHSNAGNALEILFKHARGSLSDSELQWLTGMIDYADEENLVMADTIGVLTTVENSNDKVMLAMLGLAERNKTVSAMIRVAKEAADELKARGGAQ